MRPRPTLLLRGLAKLVAVVAAASLAGIGLGAGLASLSGDSTPSSPVAAATGSTRTASTTTRHAVSTTGTATQAASPATRPSDVVGTANPDVDVEVLSARLGSPSPTTGHARVNVEIRVTNRAKTPVQITTAVLITGDFNVPLDVAARDAAAGLLTPIAAAASATGRLRFTTPTGATQRLLAKPTGHLRIADQTIELPLQTPQQTTTTG